MTIAGATALVNLIRQSFAVWPLRAFVAIFVEMTSAITLSAWRKSFFYSGASLRDAAGGKAWSSKMLMVWRVL